MRQFFSSCNQDSSLMTGYSVNLGQALIRHRAELVERAGRVEAERAHRVMTQFIANMSHELRTPLNAIIGFSHHLKDNDEAAGDPRQVEEYSTYIHRSAQTLLHIINEILNISKIQSGKVQVAPEDMSLNEVLLASAREFEQAARDGGVELSMELADEERDIHADPAKIKQIFTNIISNAVKFTARGGRVDIRVRWIGDDTVETIIRDDGIGMSAEDIAVAITPFGQVESKLTSGKQGTGLGLPIARALIEMHGGRLDIASARGCGTNMVIKLPVKGRFSGAI